MVETDKQKIIPIMEDVFHHDGRGPELQCVVWNKKGVILKGFEYFNPEDVYDEANIKHLELIKVEACSQASEEVHNNICAARINSKAAIFRIDYSNWMAQYRQTHLKGCVHYQIMFYDEIYDVICKEIKAGKGRIKIDHNVED